MGVLVSRRRTGACKALVWSDEAARYHCGLMLRAHVQGQQPGWRHPLRALWWHWVKRMISSGSGCDATLEVSGPPQDAVR